jgi:uncharacterized protein YceH (UPF0502 family)
MFHFASIEDLESCMDGLARGDSPLVKLLPQQPGQKERRYVHLFSAEPEGGWLTAVREAPMVLRAAPDPAVLEELKLEVAGLREELAGLKAQFAEFKKQFE